MFYDGHYSCVYFWHKEVIWNEKILIGFIDEVAPTGFIPFQY